MKEVIRKAKTFCTFMGGLIAGAAALWSVCASVYAWNASKKLGVDWWTHEDLDEETED